MHFRPVVIVATLLAAAPALAKEPVFGFGRKPVQTGPLGRANAAHYLADIEDYTEYWTHAFVFKSGHALYARMLVTNLGPGDNKGAVVAHMVTPEGDVCELVDGRRDRDWSYSQAGLDYRLAGHALTSSDGREFQLRLKNEKGEVQLAFTNTIESYRPGRIAYGSKKEQFLDLSVTSPRATARGTFTPAGGRTVELEGVGYADHFYSNFAQHKQVVTWYTLVGFGEDWTVNLTSIVPSKSYGYRRVGFLAVGRGNEIAFTSNAMSFGQARFWRDSKSKNKYRVPRLIRFSAKNKKTGDIVRGRAVAKKRLQRWDVLSGLASFERFVVERLAQPYQYRFLVTVELEGQIGGKRVSGKGEGLLEVNHVNKRN